MTNPLSQSQPETQLDPVTFAVFRNALTAATDKVFAAFKRTGMVPLIYDGHDFAVSLYDAKFNLVTESAAIPLFAGALGSTVPVTVETIGLDNIRAGDVLLTNLPHLNGSHPADAVLIQPIFLDGKVMAFMALRAHMGDLGAASISPSDTTDVFQEGLLIPPIKFYQEGRLQDAVLQIIRANSRIPVPTAGDFLAGAGALGFGVVAVEELLRRYGTDVYWAVVDGILEHGERAARATITTIPDGVYSAETTMDDNGVDKGIPVLVKVTVTVAGSEITVDLTGSAPQQGGPINCPMAYTQAAARMALKTLADSSFPSNSGGHRPLKVVAPEGSIFNPQQGTPSFSSVQATVQLVEAMLHALAPALPDRVPAMSYSDIIVAMGLMAHPRTGRHGIAVYVAGGGYGAMQGKDGSSALNCRSGSGLRSVPAEVLESRFPVVRHRWALDADSGGAGTWRGGLGMIEEVEYLVNGTGSTTGYKSGGSSQILGLAGGKSPRRLNGIRFNVDTDREVSPPDIRTSKVPFVAGDRYVAWTAGGGGFGNPTDRDPAAVEDDVRNGYVSRAAAEDIYGVVIDEHEVLDGTATEERRKLMSLPS